MPEIDATLTFTVIIALAAIFSPIFVAIINNIYNFKIRKAEYAEHNVIRAYEREMSEYEANVIKEKQLYYDYLSSCSSLIWHLSAENLTNYGKFYPLVLIRLDDSLAKEVQDLNFSIMRGIDGRVNSATKLNSLVPKIKNIIKVIK